LRDFWPGKNQFLPQALSTKICKLINPESCKIVFFARCLFILYSTFILGRYPIYSNLDKKINARSSISRRKYKMKKILVIVSAVMVALVIFGAGFVFAQSNVAQAAGLPAGYGPGNMTGGRGGMMGGGQMHEYVEQALADKLGMTKADVETALDGGKSMYQLAIDKGVKEADVTALLTEVHKTAFAKAVADGVMTQAQADLMLQNMTANGFTGTPMQNGAGMMRGNRGGGRGQGGMMGGWNQQQSTTTP
jgi:hypothetical protein